ncbi:hypothetical protein [Nocardia tengchongensis]|uniref:hypothetical protein n=1 Tax=Nocardia tengchongensis TaxID=2055889 RepID=UPI003655C308
MKIVRAGGIAAAVGLLMMAGLPFKAREQERRNVTALAASLGGEEGWPGEAWLARYSRHLNPCVAQADVEHPIRTRVGDYDCVSFRTYHVSADTSFGALFASADRYTGSAVSGIDAAVPPMEVLSAAGDWRTPADSAELTKMGYTRITSGDLDFDQQYSVYVQKPGPAARLLTAEVKESLLSMRGMTPRLRLFDSLLVCWVHGHDVRAEPSHRGLMKGLAKFAEALEAAVRHDSRRRHAPS